MSERVEFDSNGLTLISGAWSPFIGQETLELLHHKGFVGVDGVPTQAGEMIQNETVRIMEACGSPTSTSNSETGLVIGYVQSGKTLSFTTLTALARDNNYQAVIIIAGTSKPLFNQSTARLSKDLRLEDRNDRKWTLMTNPNTVEDRDTIRSAMQQWADTTYPRSRCRTMLIMVMKHGQHLANLRTVLQSTGLDRVPVLIIDDEGDQASMNTKARAAARQGNHISESEWSTIYRRINELRDSLANHTFLQYTATPQAPLFINIMDRLSPNFIKLLTPGADYTGGRTFFIQHPNLVRAIPSGEIATPNEPLHEAPASLREALMIFYLGVAAGLPNQDGVNRTMMVHPSRLQGDHNQYFNFVNNIVSTWQRTLSFANEEEDKKELLREFHDAYRDLQVTVEGIMPFEELVRNHLTHAVRYTRIIEVNASRGNTPQIPWRDEYSFILVGGQAMDRGFTVEGLTVTYMPRGMGTSNVDTIQQRARFFGYKRRYLGYCRVYLDQSIITSYRAIIEHEEDVRNNLAEFNETNRHLDQWDRRAVLNTMLNLTRPSVLYNELERDVFGSEWFTIKAPHDTEHYIHSNSQELSSFLERHSNEFQRDVGHPRRTEDQIHLVAELSLGDCLDNLLNRLIFTRERDSASFTSLKSVMRMQLIQTPTEQCRVYLMSTQTSTITHWEPRVRKLTTKDEIQNLFQGRNPRIGEIVYPGDSEIKDINQLTIQIHLLNIRDTNFQRVPTISIWIPERMSRDIIRQVPSIV